MYLSFRTPQEGSRQTSNQTRTQADKQMQTHIDRQAQAGRQTYKEGSLQSRKYNLIYNLIYKQKDNNNKEPRSNLHAATR